MFKDISKHSLVFVVIRKHDQVCDEVPFVPRAKSVQRALPTLSQRALSAIGSVTGGNAHEITDDEELMELVTTM